MLPKDLLEKSEKEIKEMISEVGLDHFSKALVSYLEHGNNLDDLKNNLELLEKVAIAIDSVLACYQMLNIGKAKKTSPVNTILINKFINLYSANSRKMYECR